MPNRRIWQSLGRETILECTITALPQAISYWQKNGRRITNTLHPSSDPAAAAAGDDDDAGDDLLVSVARPSGLPKYRIEAYEEGVYTLTLNLRLQVRNAHNYHRLFYYLFLISANAKCPKQDALAGLTSAEGTRRALVVRLSKQLVKPAFVM